MAARARAMAAAQPAGALYDVLLLGGTVYDAANGIDGVTLGRCRGRY